jgi:hypothetical protein
MLNEVIQVPGDIRVIVPRMSGGDERCEQNGGGGEAKAQGFHGRKISRLRASVGNVFGQAREEFVRQCRLNVGQALRLPWRA